MGLATTPQAITRALTVTPIIGIRIGTIGIGDTTVGITIESCNRFAVKNEMS